MGLFCDLTKAFDSVSHELLILKLGFSEVKGSIFNWSKYYLHNRKQSVVLQFVSSPNLLSYWEIQTWSSSGICFGPITVQCLY